MQTTAVVVPCYNEEKRLHLDEFRKAAEAHPAIHYFFVNDGSTDKTADVLQAFCKENPAQLYYLAMPQNSGKAEAVRTGVCHALQHENQYEFVAFWDADLATPLSDVPTFVELLQATNHNIVMGSRVKLLGRNVERQLLRHYLGRIFATCASFLLKLPVYDTQCGAKMFRNTPEIRRAFSEPFRVDWIFDVELLGRLLLLERQGEGAKVVETTIEYPLQTWTDVPGSKVRPAHFIKAGFEFFKIAWMMFRGKPPAPLTSNNPGQKN